MTYLVYVSRSLYCGSGCGLKVQVQFSYYLEGLPINTVVVSDLAHGVHTE
jgi:hypothetical protein